VWSVRKKGKDKRTFDRSSEGEGKRNPKPGNSLSNFGGGGGRGIFYQQRERKEGEEEGKCLVLSGNVKKVGGN